MEVISPGDTYSEVETKVGQFVYEPSQRHWPIIVRFHLSDELRRESLCLCYHPAWRIAKQLLIQVVPISVFPVPT